MAAGLATAIAPGVVEAVDSEALRLARATLTDRDEVRRAAIGALVERGRPDAASVLVDLWLFHPEDAGLLADGLRRLTGEPIGDAWSDWMVWRELNPQVRPFAGYDAFKAAQLAALDPAFLEFVAPGAPAAIRIEEIVWGGVAKDGIPALTAPAFVEAGRADWLWPGELVFGVEIEGDIRAYPHRIMDWHELANDTVGGVDVALAYCTLCGAGVLYERRVAGRSASFEFGTSGLLYRSNKLMYDRQTSSLWNHMTGTPAVGPLVGSGIRLQVRPMVVARWERWRAMHPQTRVLSLDTGHRRDYEPGRPYGGYFENQGLMFPAAIPDGRLRPKDRVFGVRLSDGAKAWPVAAFRDGRAFDDAVGTTPVVVFGFAEDGAIRAYRRDGVAFRDDLSDGRPVDSSGFVWRTTEEALLGPDGRRLARLPGHVAFWFGWRNLLGPDAALAGMR